MGDEADDEQHNEASTFRESVPIKMPEWTDSEPEEIAGLPAQDEDSHPPPADEVIEAAPQEEIRMPPLPPPQLNQKKTA